MSKEKKKKDPVVMTLDLVIVILIFVMLGVGIRLLFYKSIAKERSNFSQDAGRMAFDVERNDYASLIRARYMNEFNGYEATEYHALADYVEAISMYKVYNTMGYADKSEWEKDIMERSRKDMKELTVFADRIDEMFLRRPVR
ncbi:MAG: hypothetical protein K6F34_05025 [Lachnospiraceae bacterium]|nr:hypothetical protein [Lachnospiraceae bacterium]